MKKIIKKKWYLLYFLFIGITLCMFFFHDNDNYVDTFVEKENISFSENWNYEFPGERSGRTSLPTTLPKTTSQTLILKNTLPEIDDATSFFFFVRHVAVKIYVNGELRVDAMSNRESKGQWENIIGGYYQEVPISSADSGKEIVIETFGKYTRYLISPGEVYLGDRGSLFLHIIKSNWKTLLCTILIAFLGITLFILWLISTFLMKNKSKELVYLSLFCISVACWLFTESNCGQFIMEDTGKLALIAYEVLILMPIPVALFFAHYCDDEEGKAASLYATIVPLVIFVLNNFLHLFRIMYLPDTLLITQIMLVFEIIGIGMIQIREIGHKYRKTGDIEYNAVVWKIPLFGIIILVPLAITEVVKYIFFATKYPNDGILITIGVLFYMTSLAFDSVVRINVGAMKYKHSAEAKTQFLANMSHEIRTPLNAMLSFNEVILRISKEEKTKKCARNIQESGESLKNIINSILDITKIESGKLEIYAVEYSTVLLLDHIVSMFEALVRKKGLVLFTDIDDNLPEILIGDENHIMQILTNIMNNAVKYTDTGSITLTVKVLEMYENMPLCRLYISVKDTGVGIKPEDKARLFEKFERLDEERNYSKEGTGLGMSIVVQILSAMDSKIELDSVYGQGSDFHFELVQSVVNRKAIGSFIEKRKELALQNSQGIDFIAPDAKILIVDDVQMNLDATSALLEQLQMEIHTAQSGKEALQRIRQNHYDMVFMDHMMPEMDGIEAIEKIRDMANIFNDPYYAELPIIALTANAMVGMKENFLQAGMQDFISKPIEVNAMNAVIKKWLPKNLVQKVTNQQVGTNRTESGEHTWEEVPGCVNVATARQFSTTYQLFMKNLKSYSANYETTRDKLRQFKEQQDVENYTITVHGLKSTSKMIGLVHFSNFALDQEEKCQNGQEDLVWEETENLLTQYEMRVKDIRTFLDKNNEEVEKESVDSNISEEEYSMLLQRIKEAADNFDIGAFMMLEDELEAIAVPKEKQEEFSKIREMIANTSFGDLSEYLCNL